MRGDVDVVDAADGHPVRGVESCGAGWSADVVRLWNTPCMKRATVAIVVTCMLLLGCGSDGESAQTTPTDSTEAASAATTSAAPAAPETTGSAPAVDAPPAPLTPEAVCVGNYGEVYFGYDNASAEPVIIAEGDANELSGVNVDDNPLLTTLFAPGKVDVAFWAYPDSESDVVWTLTGPDGVERTASGGLTTERCAADFLADADDRSPAVEVVGQTIAADGQSADVELRLTGVDETSVCNEAFDAEPLFASIGDGTALPTAFEPEATVTVGPFFEAALGGQLASTTVYALIVDRCSYAGVTAEAWPLAPAANDLTFGTVICARLDDAGALTVELKVSPCDLPATGGSSIRPR